jgi:hypothetical protein
MDTMLWSGSPLPHDVFFSSKPSVKQNAIYRHLKSGFQMTPQGSSVCKLPGGRKAAVCYALNYRDFTQTEKAVHFMER